MQYFLFWHKHSFRSYMKHALLLLLSACMAASRLHAQSAATVDHSPLDSIPALMARYHVPVMAVGIIEEGRIKTIRTYGNLRAYTPAPPNTLFNVASLTKPVVTMVTLQLVSNGSWQLDEPLSHYWTDPDLQKDPRHHKLTTRLVLTHQTGFPNWRSSNPGNKLAFIKEPGDGTFGYSGEGFEYLRRALEAKFGRSLQQLADSLLFQPLKIKNTHFAWAPGMDTLLYAQPHGKTGELLAMERNTDPNAADWLVTTIIDYTLFGAHVIGGGHLSPALFQEMVTPVIKAGKSPLNEYMGLGWAVVPNMPGNEYMIMHTGHDPGVYTLIALYPKSKRGIVIFTNGDDGMKAIVKVAVGAFHLNIPAE
ncbi:serine hydrolase [Chitinophaga sp. Mgbs1]|uniref:Serine hydrolase n=1 Tax=Chitinophaga solisilvae TaxID=1233460 RepID=A0A9Q5GSN8_9BACT|nr:serine hydrolase [Chitinophaga solisilvae]